MDWLTFFSKIIDSLVWPIITVWSLYFFLYKNGPKLARIVESIKCKYFTLKFRNSIEKAIEQAEKTIKFDLKQITTEEISEIEKIATISPALAIVEIWQNLESQISRFFLSVSQESKKAKKFDLIRSLKLKKLINDNELELLNRLREIRNLAVHTNNRDCITTSEIIEYKILSDRIIKKLKDKKGMWII